MALSGRKLASTTLLAVTFVLFVPAFAQASGELSYGSWTYGGEFSAVVEYIPLVVALLAAMVLANAFLKH